MKVTVEAYKYEDLDQQNQFEVEAWLEWFDFFDGMKTQDVVEHCEANEYLFNKFGEPIHHLIIK